MHYFDLPIFMISFDSHWPIRFCSSGHTNQIPPTPNQLSLSLSLIGCCHPSNTAVVGHCQWCNRPSFSPFHIVFSLSLSLEIDSLFHYLSITWSQLSFSLIFFFFLLVSDMYLDLKLFFFFFFFNFSRSPPPKSDQISAVGLQGVVKKAMPLVGGIGR